MKTLDFMRFLNEKKQTGRFCPAPGSAPRHYISEILCMQNLTINALCVQYSPEIFYMGRSRNKLNALFNDGYISDLTITFPGKK